MNHLDYQTRTENGELKFFATFAEAFAEYKKDPTVMKISWYVKPKDYRWRPKTKGGWSPESEKKLCEMSADYAKEPENSKKVFWVHQSVCPEGIRDILLDETITKHQREIKLNLAALLEILTEEEFVSRYMG